MKAATAVAGRTDGEARGRSHLSNLRVQATQAAYTTSERPAAKARRAIDITAATAARRGGNGRRPSDSRLSQLSSARQEGGDSATADTGAAAAASEQGQANPQPSRAGPEGEANRQLLTTKRRLLRATNVCAGTRQRLLASLHPVLLFVWTFKGARRVDRIRTLSPGNEGIRTCSRSSTATGGTRRGGKALSSPTRPQSEGNPDRGNLQWTPFNTWNWFGMV